MLNLKIKYVELKNKIQTGGSIMHNIMDIIELYDKTFNLYMLYRFRYDNTLPLINLIELSEKVFKFKTYTRCDFKNYYIKDLLENDNVTELLKKEVTKQKVIFTLRQDTTKLIKDVLLPNNESISKVNLYMDFISINDLLQRGLF